MNKLVSVVIPIFNGEKYLKDFLKTVVNQTYRPLQIIMGDDGSSDSSYDICVEWKRENEKEDFQIIFIRYKQNIGLSQNVSRLAQYIKGNYIFLADQDDIWMEEKIECQVQYLEENSNCSVCLCDRAVTNENLEIMEKSYFAYRSYTIHSMNFKEVIMHKGIYSANCMAIRNMGDIKQLFNIPSNVISHDTFIVMMAVNYGSIDFLFEVLELYRIHGKNLSGNFQAQFSRNRLHCFINYLKIGKRMQKSAKYDGDAVRTEMKKRFGVNIDDYPNCYQRKMKIVRFTWAWKMTKKASNNNLIGKWRKGIRAQN